MWPGRSRRLFTKATSSPSIYMRGASLVVASGVQPKLSPSFETGTEKLMEFGDGDIVLDTDLDAYSVDDLRADRAYRAQATRTHPRACLDVVLRRRRPRNAQSTEAIRDLGFNVDAS